MACETVSLGRHYYYYQPKSTDDSELIDVLSRLAEKHPRYGFRKLYRRLRLLGYCWNHKRVYRIYCGLKLNLRIKPKKKLPIRKATPLTVPTKANDCWSMDFMSDCLTNGQSFRTFNVIDDYNRESLAIEIDFSLPTERVIRVLGRIAEYRGYPASLRQDNGPEFISSKLKAWAKTHNVKLNFIQLGKPTQNAFIERFNRTYRNEVLDFYLFNSLTEVREITDNWVDSYNYERPHESLNDLPPKTYEKQKEKNSI